MEKILGIEEVEGLLSEIREKIQKYGLYFLKTKDKNRQTLARLGIMADRVIEVIEDLRAEDYCGGPDPDDKYAWRFVSVFGKQFDGIELYIKLSVSVWDEKVVCLSFHEAERAMTYQFK